MQDAADIRFSKSELNSLAKTKSTCVTLEKKARVVFLLPSQLSDIKTGIRENLDSNLYKYDYETKAIMIGYEKIKILSKYGSICYGYSKIALRIEANFYLFKPAVGRILQGVVSKQSGRHLGCLVHKGFNVSIPLEDEDGYTCGWDFTIGQDVRFTVVKMDLASGPLPYILGQLYVDGVDCGASGVGGKEIRDGGAGERCGGIAPSPPIHPPLGGEGCWGGEATPEGEGRNSLISQLLRTVEMSIAEEAKGGSPKKGKQKRVSIDAHEGPSSRPLSNVVPLPPPLDKAAEQLPEVTTGGKGGQKRGAGTKKGGSTVDGDSGSIIGRLLEMSRRELLGETPRGKKRKAEDGCEEGSKRKHSRKSEGSGAAQVSVKSEYNLGTNWHHSTEELIGAGKWSSTLVPSDSSVPSITHQPSELRVSSQEESKLGLTPPELLASPKPMPPSKAKRKSLPIKLETYKHEK